MDRRKAEQLKQLPEASEIGLTVIAEAVQEGVRKLWLHGDNERSALTYQSRQVLLGPGAYSTILERGTMAPLELNVNGRLVSNRPPSGLGAAELAPLCGLLGGSMTLLPREQTGRVILVDRGVSFQFGPLLGSTLVVANISPQQGKPWPSNLVMNTDLKQILESVIRQCWRLEERAAEKIRGRPALATRLLSAVRRRQRFGNQEGAQRLLSSLLRQGTHLARF